VAERDGKHAEIPIIINTKKEDSLRSKHWRDKVGKHAKYGWKQGVLFSAIGSSA
jgi:hypothetical protein